MLDNYITLDLNMPTIDNGYSAVAAACMSGHFDIVTLLCENGVDVNQVDGN
jgi:ankyrin repeat protein